MFALAICVHAKRRDPMSPSRGKGADFPIGRIALPPPHPGDLSWSEPGVPAGSA